MRLLSPARCWLLLAPLALRPSPAMAHAGLPETSNVTVRRGHPQELFVGATFGAVVSRDSGKSWQWICPEAMAYDGWSPESFLWQPDGHLLAATGNALIRSLDGGCTWTKHSYFVTRKLWPRGLASPASEPSRVWVVTYRSDDEAFPPGLYRSDDGGETFTPQLEGTGFNAVQVAPSDNRRLYVSGVSGDIPGAVRLYRSDDEGENWDELVPTLPAFEQPSELFVLRVAEDDPDHLWARISSIRNTEPRGIFTYVLESKDGGRTFQSVLHPAQQAVDGLDEYIVGIETSADAGTLWAATPSRFFRSRNAEPAVLLPLPEGNACVQREGDALLVCGSTWVHDWALARTRDEGDTYEPLFSLPDIQPPSSCPAGTPVHDRCRPLWPQFASSIGANPTLPGAPDAGTPDAGSGGTQPPPKANGCSATGGLVPTACFLSLTLFRRSRRHPPET
jgi:hypothetical protein